MKKKKYPKKIVLAPPLVSLASMPPGIQYDIPLDCNAHFLPFNTGTFHTILVHEKIKASQKKRAAKECLCLCHPEDEEEKEDNIEPDSTATELIPGEPISIG